MEKWARFTWVHSLFGSDPFWSLGSDYCVKDPSWVPVRGRKAEKLEPRSRSGERMVYIQSWDEFMERSVQMFRASPDSVSISLNPSISAAYFLFLQFSAMFFWFYPAY